MTTETLYKVLSADLRSMHGGTGEWVPGEWRSVRGALEPCRRGLHLARDTDLVRWLGPTIWVAEYDGERIDADDKVIVRRARIVSRVEAWDERTARLFAATCAEDVLHLIPEPQRAVCAETIAVARRHADGLATDAHLSAALSAARSAARSARSARSAAAWSAWAAAWSAAAWSAESAAWSAESAARSAASAAWAAAVSAAESARWAALPAARSAAWSAESAALSAAGSAQTDRLLDMLGIAR